MSSKIIKRRSKNVFNLPVSTYVCMICMNSKEDKFASERKKDHIELAFESQTLDDLRDSRFFYEPAINHMKSEKQDISLDFLGGQMDAPIWVSSMTGGTEMAGHINKIWFRLSYLETLIIRP